MLHSRSFTVLSSVAVAGALSTMSSTALAADWKILEQSPAHCASIAAFSEVDLVCIQKVGGFGAATIIKSTDGGKSWGAPVSGPQGLPTTFSNYFRDANTGFFGRFGSADPSTVVVRKTADGGTTWIDKKLTTAGHGQLQIRSVHFKGAVGNAVGFSTETGPTSTFIARSEDDGETWKEQTLPGGTSTSGEIGDAVWTIDATTAVLVTDKEIWRTTNSGAEWKAVSTKTPGNAFVKFVDAMNGYAGAFFKTSDGGATWTAANLPKNPTNEDLRAVDFADAQHGLAVFAGSSGVTFFRTADGGGNWTSEDKPATYAYLAQALAYPSVNVAYASGSLPDPATGPSVVSSGTGTAGTSSGGTDAGPGPGTTSGGTSSGATSSGATGGGTSSGTADGGASPAASGGDDSGCNVQGGTTSGAGAALFGLAVALLLRRRRR